MDTRDVLELYQKFIDKGLDRFGICGASKDFEKMWTNKLFQTKIIELAKDFLKETPSEFFSVNEFNEYDESQTYIFDSKDNLYECYQEIGCENRNKKRQEIRENFLKYLIKNNICIFQLITTH